MKTPNLNFKIEVLYLLEWPMPWSDGHGFDRIHAIYKDYDAAVEAGHGVIQDVFKDDDEAEMERNFRIFDHAREDGTHYCGGVTLKPVPYITTP